MDQTFKQFIPPSSLLLLEAFDQGVTMGELKNYYFISGDYVQQKDFIKTTEEGETFSFSYPFLNFLKNYLNLDNYSDETFIFSIDLGAKKFKIARAFMGVLQTPLTQQKNKDKFKDPKDKILDPKLFKDIFGDGSLSKNFIQGLNQGEISEIIFILGIYLYLLKLGEVDNFTDELKTLINSDLTVKNSGSSVFLTGESQLSNFQIECSLYLGIKLKNKDIINLLNRDEVTPFIHSIKTFLANHSEGYWNKLVHQIKNHQLNEVKITVLGQGHLDREEDKSDLKIIIEPLKPGTIPSSEFLQPKFEEGSEELPAIYKRTSHAISLKYDNMTMSRIALTGLDNITKKLKYLNIIIDRNTIKDLVENLPKEKVNKEAKGKKVADLILKEIYNGLSSQLYNKDSELESKFNTLTLLSNLANFFIKGTHSHTHKIKSFSLIDLSKDLHISLDDLELLTQTQDKELLEKLNVPDIQVRYTTDKGEDHLVKLVAPNTHNIPVTFLHFRYSARDLKKSVSRYEIYVEIVDLKLFKTIIEKLTLNLMMLTNTKKNVQSSLPTILPKNIIDIPLNEIS